MINLTPIAKKIQQRLFEKMKVLGRSADNSTNTPIIDNDGNKNKLTHEKLSVRAPFLRMTSGQTSPVVLMGGKVKEDGNIPGGYDDIYGPRSYMVGSGLAVGKDVTVDPITDNLIFKDTRNTSDNTEEITVQTAVEIDKQFILQNNSGRPTPGVKSVEANFKGGLRAIREATVQWTCWDWEELQLLSPHFLSHGHTVMVEWGWVYDDSITTQLYNFMTKDEAGNRVISQDAFDNYRNKIIESNGDFDMMVGIIKNFEYTTRDDGGFDCTTILTSVGASVLDNPQPNKDAIDPNITYNLSFSDVQEGNDAKAVAALKDATDGNGELDEEEKNKLIDLNTSVSMKLFIRNIDAYLLSILDSGNDIMHEDDVDSKNNALIRYNPNQFITVTRSADKLALNAEKQKAGDKNKPSILDKIASFAGFSDEEIAQGNKNLESFEIDPSLIGGKVINAKGIDAEEFIDKDCWVRWGWFEDNILSKFLSVTSEKDIITQFRSIEPILFPDGTETGRYESVKIKNHKRLETVNLSSYILPGQFYPVEQQSIQGYTVKGDSPFLHKLKYVVSNYFSRFSSIGDEDGVNGPNAIQRQALADNARLNSVQRQALIDANFPKNNTNNEDLNVYGYLRNMLINTKVIKQAFGISGSDDKFTVESINVVEAIETMFSLLNRDLNFWNFRLVVDETETHRAKIIDEQVTNFDFSQKTNKQKSTPDNPDKVFFFPVWRSDSIVKRQNVTTKIPDALALTAMYGANFDKVSEFSNPGNQFTDKGALIAGAMFNNQQDNHKQGFNIAVRDKKSETIGVEHGTNEEGNFIDDANTPLQIDKGKGIRKFLIDNSKLLTETFEDKLIALNEKMEVSSEKDEDYESKYDTSVPPPLLGGPYQDLEVIKQILIAGTKEDRVKDSKNEKGQTVTTIRSDARRKFLSLISSKFRKVESNFLLNPDALNTISYLTTQHGKSKQINTPVLVPFDIELQIDGIGGIYPSNSFQSSYLPARYQNNTVFQIFDVNHTLNESGWSVTITGKMRSTIGNVIDFKDITELVQEQLEAYSEQAGRIAQNVQTVINVDEAFDNE